jgi:hypothetical protein
MKQTWNRAFVTTKNVSDSPEVQRPLLPLKNKESKRKRQTIAKHDFKHSLNTLIEKKHHV